MVHGGIGKANSLVHALRGAVGEKRERESVCGEGCGVEKKGEERVCGGRVAGLKIMVRHEKQ